MNVTLYSVETDGSRMNFVRYVVEMLRILSTNHGEVPGR